MRDCIQESGLLRDGCIASSSGTGGTGARDLFTSAIGKAGLSHYEWHPGCTALRKESQCRLEGPRKETQSQLWASQYSAAALQAPAPTQACTDQPSEPSPLPMDPNGSSSLVSRPGRLATRENPSQCGSQQGWVEKRQLPGQSDFWNPPFTKTNQKSRHSKIHRQKADQQISGCQGPEWESGGWEVEMF